MIIVQLKGGLGNQMFQYAAGRALAHLRKTELKLDLSYLNGPVKETDTKRSYELNIFNQHTEIATQDEVLVYRKNAEKKVMRMMYREFSSMFKKIYAAESGHAYQTNFKKFPADTYLDGYWQSEKYFSFIEKIIRKDLSFKEPLTGSNAEYAHKMQNTESVSLHVRRGDYASNPIIQAYHGACSPGYYNAAVKSISEKLKNIELFIFSDDMDWCKQNLSFNFPCNYITHNKGEKSFEDMRLMSLCKHNIIANSSFSWWGAWLNNNSKKEVVAPKKWFQTAENPDIYPENWEQL